MTVTKQRRKKLRWGKIIPAYCLMLPGIAYLIINNYIPMFGIIMAFKKINFKKGLLGSAWVGFDNFEFLFSSGNAWRITRNTIAYNVVFIILGIVIPITVAILINEIRSKFASKVYQTIVILPAIVSWVVVNYLAYAFLSLETGFINNSIMAPLGLEAIDFYQEPKWWPFILIFLNQWKGFGFTMVMYLSSILAISSDYFEAAKIDGAGKWQQIRYITLPGLKSTVITLFILNIGGIFYSDFGLFYQIPRNSGRLYEVTQTIDTFVYNALMVRNDFGMSSAASFYQAIVGFVMILAANWIIRKVSPEDSLF